MSSEICIRKAMVLCVVLGNFIVQLDANLYLNIERFMERCIGQSATARSSCTRSPQRWAHVSSFHPLTPAPIRERQYPRENCSIKAVAWSYFPLH